VAIEDGVYHLQHDSSPSHTLTHTHLALADARTYFPFIFHPIFPIFYTNTCTGRCFSTPEKEKASIREEKFCLIF